MDRSGQRREIVFCHQCENEWFRDEHGLSCPQCRSDFTEIVEAGRDPREELQDLPNPLHTHDYNAPDPDEEDISNMGWQQAPGRGGGTTFSYTRGAGSPGQTQQQGLQGALPPLMGTFASILGNIVGGGRGPPPGWQQTGPGPGSPSGQGLRVGSPDGNSSRSTSAPGYRTTIRSGGGPGMQWTITTTHGGAAHTQGPSGHPADMDPMLQMMMGGGHGHGLRGPGPFGSQHGPPGGPEDDPLFAMGPLGPLIHSILNPQLGRIGDGVYSQEALDRIITQLMEQNASGNAPGPAPAEAISALPKRKIDEKDLGQEHKAECSICMEEVNIGEEVTELPCHHWFHGECIKAWLGEHDTCPHCRQGILPKEEETQQGQTRRPRRPNEPARHDAMWGQGDGSRTRPYIVAGSPEPSERHVRRRQSSQHHGVNSRHNGGNEGLLSRMRNAFGGGGSGSGSGSGGGQS